RFSCVAFLNSVDYVMRERRRRPFLLRCPPRQRWRRRSPHHVNFGAPITRYSSERSLLVRCILAFASSPLTACGGPPLTRCCVTGCVFRNHGGGPSCGPRHDSPGAAAGLAGSTGAGAGAVSAPTVGGMNVSVAK